MLNDASRRKFDVVMAWAIDRVGRSLIDLLAIIQLLERCGVDLYLDKQNIDTTTPMGRFLFQVTGAFAEFERSMIRQRVQAGSTASRPRSPAMASSLPRLGLSAAGRPGAEPEQLAQARQLLAGGKGIINTTRTCKLGTGTVQKLKGEMLVAAA